MPSTREGQRASRRERTRGRLARLHDRDLDILLALAKMRLLRTSDLTRLFFTAKGTCQKRLRKLYDAGLVRAVVGELCTENRYAIARFGHALLEEAFPSSDLPPFRSAPRIDRRGATHLDLLNAYRIALALGAAANGFELRSFLADWDLRSMDPLATLVPDAIFAVVASGSEPLSCALEVDAGTEAGHVVLRKLTKYRERHALRQSLFGFKPDLVILLTKTERRARSLAKQIARDGGVAAAPVVLLGIEETVMGCGGIVKGLTMSKALAEGDQAKAAFTVGLGKVFQKTE